MKQIFTLTLLLSLITSLSVAQELGTQDTLAADSIGDLNDSVEVVITPKKGQDSTIVKVAGMKIIVLNDKNGSREDIIIDTEVDPDFELDDDDDSDYNEDDVTHWAGIRVGVNGYMNNAPSLTVPSTASFLELDYAKSISWDLNLFEKDFNLYRNNVELVTGLGLHFANYTFKSKYTTLSNTDPLSVTTDSSKILEKNKLKATYLAAPLMLGFATNQDEDKAFRIAVGGQVSWKINSKLKQRYTVLGETYKPKIKSDYDLNPFLFHATASVGYGPVNVYANYGLNTLFESGKTADLVSFDIGLQLMF